VKLTPTQLSAHLAKGLAPVYALGGEEPLLIQEALDAIRAAARTQGYTEREVLDVERGFDWQRLADVCASMSLFSSRRIVQLNLPSGAPGVEGGRTLTALAAKPPPDVLFLLVCGEIEWRSRQGGWYAALERAGAALYCEPPKGDLIPQWLAQRARQEGVELEAEALQELAERTEGNLLAAVQDLSKLKLLFPGQRVSAAQLREAVMDSARFEAFDLNDRWLAGDAEGGVRSLARLREEGAALPEILGAVVFSLRQLAKAASIYAQTRSADVACDRAGVRRPSRPLFASALARVRPAETLGWLSRCARIDAMSKTGQEAAAWEELLTLILAASGASRTV
jgi:DNA polymerase III subunit delta